MLRTLFSTALLLSAWTSIVTADDGNPAYTSADEAPIDFRFQGEYVGSPDDDPTVKIGVQVIALGEGKFDIVAYIGGLPGDGWSRGDEVIRATGELSGDKVVAESDGGTAEIKNGQITVFGDDGSRHGVLKKVERKSPTLGAKPPTGAVVLFDGSNADGFEKGELIEVNLLASSDCTSKATFQDHSMHLEFRTPFMPMSRGQGRGNSGVYLQSRFECQVLDSFGLEGENNECGGIYSISKPAVNMCLPPLSWQTYDIDYTAAKYDDEGKKTVNARVTIRHNGVVIHDDIELTHGTPGCQPEGPSPLGVFLQNHGNPVAFRNIWAVAK